MKAFFKSNIWITALALCLDAFLDYRAIETKECVEINLACIIHEDFGKSPKALPGS